MVIYRAEKGNMGIYINPDKFYSYLEKGYTIIKEDGGVGSVYARPGDTQVEVPCMTQALSLGEDGG